MYSMGRKNRRIDRGKISRIGTYAIASSIADRNSISCTTFNILAPIYNRLNKEDQSCRESDNRGYWLNRNQRILDWLLDERSSIICLQEFWVGNEELVNMYESRLSEAGYINFKLARTNKRGDDRVAQLLHVELVGPLSQCQSNKIRQEMLIVNTHLFPHDATLCLVRLNQVYKILQCVKAYQEENKLNPLPIMLCGDWNGSKRGHIYKFLRSLGFVSSYDSAYQYNDTDTQKWISHRNHRGNICGVDFIWLLNPNRYRKLLGTNWAEAVFGMFKYLLRRGSLTDNDAFAFLKADSDGDYITFSGFCEALRQLNLTGHCHGLSVEQTKELWDQADTDGNGVIDYKEFQQRIWNPTWSEKTEDNTENAHQNVVDETKDSIGFSVKNAVLFPTEVEKGLWPEDYSLSDHARLTVVLSPVRMPCLSLLS